MGRIACATSGCGTFWLDHDLERQLRRTHSTFYCPAGHSQWFPGKTDEEKRIEELEARIARMEEWDRRDSEQYAEQYRVGEEIRAVLRSCPLCLARSPRRPRYGYDVEGARDYIAAHREWFVEHLRTEHGADGQKQIPAKTGDGHGHDIAAK